MASEARALTGASFAHMPAPERATGFDAQTRQTGGRPDDGSPGAEIYPPRRIGLSATCAVDLLREPASA